MSPPAQRGANEDEIKRAETQAVGQRPATEEEIRRAEGRSGSAPRPKQRSWRFWRRKEGKGA